MILLLPTFIGGLWQLIALANISVSYIRFFSATQLMADGILFLFVLIMSAVVFMIGERLTRTDNKWYLLVTFILSTPFLVLFIIGIVREIILPFGIILLGIMLSIPSILATLKLIILTSEKQLSNLKNQLAIFVIVLFILLTFIFGFIKTSEGFHRLFSIPESNVNFTRLRIKIEGDYSPEMNSKILYFNDKFIFVEIELEGKTNLVEIYELNELFKS